MADTTYNGWTNWETWVVNLWATNECDTYHMICELANEKQGDLSRGDALGLAEVMFGRQLIGIRDFNPNGDGWGDKRQSRSESLRKVNWGEIAESWGEHYEPVSA